MIREKWMRRCALVVACAPLVLLAGCPQDDLAAPGTVATQATAPTVATPVAAPQQASAATPAQTVESSANAYKVQQLINSAEASYRSGVENYRANRLDAARLDFDTAVDVMLTSGMDLKNDPQLSDEFEHLLNAVNSLEMAALKQGNGFSPKIEETPLESAGDLTFAPNPELTAKLKAELEIKSDLPLVINDEVAGYIGIFANSTSFQAHMRHSMERGGKYKAIIQKALADQGVPQDLYYLAVAESGFQPQVVNAKSGAGGMWQFMPFQGAYGLTRNGYFDERFDPEKSSIAYAKYMKALYNQFGDWYLAMAAYDWGPGYVQKAVMRTGYADFWELYRRNAMPKETKAYVPQILAAVIMAKNPAKYGLDKVVPDPAVVWDTEKVDYAIDMRLVADLTNSSLSEIVALNPSLLRMTTPSDLPFDLHLPVGTKGVFEERLKDIPEEKRSSWRFHVVRTGETLDGIAASLHAHPSDIVAENGMKAGETVEGGDELVVPLTVASMVKRPQRYTVRRDDTLVTVADRFNVSVEDLRSWNHLSTGGVRTGQSLNVSEPVHLAPSLRSRRAASRGRRSGLAGSSKGSSKQSSKQASKQLSTGSSRGASKSVKSSTKTSTQNGTLKSKHKAAR
ncbi:lytic transglycosylase domain-containing protein [Granulicella arctica]|uniref:Membrane-bound lytic murein transglycosylase D n=1 Tax=Granulicella arctica TaxID=940613 RepID=A0A7Y9PFJ0_9BACT|nr:lytic transglycosylase domain-containing protein [Granulicella arctica]NYF78857.1 membrane-bound lytic murein transglycosylase D [Granulicella arctica]